MITIYEYPDEHIAWHIETETYGAGDTEADAVADMTQQLLELYDDLRNSPDETLTGPALRWKRRLCDIFGVTHAQFLE